VGALRLAELPIGVGELEQERAGSNLNAGKSRASRTGGGGGGRAAGEEILDRVKHERNQAK
jgi:hypothetical protein